MMTANCATSNLGTFGGPPFGKVDGQIQSVVHASIQETVELGKARIRVGAKEIVEKSPALIEVIGGVRRAQCLVLYS